MRDSAELILNSLDRVAALVDDPSAPVYERLFEEYPHFRKLFRFETSGELARKNMFQVAVVALMEHLEGINASANMVKAERINHAHIGVENALFDRYYEVIRDTCKQILGDEWTAETEQAWDEAIAGLISATPYQG